MISHSRIGIMLLIVLMPVASVSSIVLQIQQVSASTNANASAQSSKNELSDMVLEKYKNRVLKHLFNNQTIASSISNSSIPVSIVAGVISPNGTQVSGYGNISESNHTTVDGNSIFDIGSLTKLFVGISLMDMVNQGLVKLDDPLEKYLPANVTVPTYQGHKITLQDLITHTSGLPYWPPGWCNPTCFNNNYTTQEVYQFLSNSSLATRPGVKDVYSNIGVGLLGHALSLKAGVPLEQLVKDRILNVLGMNSTGIAMNATGVSIPEDIKSRFAKGHIAGNESELAFLPLEVQGAGAMYSTVNDLLKFLSANMGLIDTKLNDAMQESRAIRHSISEFQTSFVDPSGHESPALGYVGSDWNIQTDLGKKIIWRNGGINGYSSLIAFNPDKQLGVAILCSCHFADVPPIEIISTAMTFLLYPSMNALVQAQTENMTMEELTNASLAQYPDTMENATTMEEETKALVGNVTGNMTISQNMTNGNVTA
jgi:serine-type D-Ala-D-Ala carboxypeptidase/endopeptidase